jgi:hypothetical protein
MKTKIILLAGTLILVWISFEIMDHAVGREVSGSETEYQKEKPVTIELDGPTIVYHRETGDYECYADGDMKNLVVEHKAKKKNIQRNKKRGILRFFKNGKRYNKTIKTNNSL